MMNKSARHIDRPIIILGTGRCGSTMFHRLLAQHPDVGWLSTFNEVFPRQAWLSVFSNFYRTRWLSQKVKLASYFPKPFEAYRFWEYSVPGFSRRNRPQTADDVPAEVIDPLNDHLASILHWQGKPRFLAKVTGWSRVGLFNRLFPDARFIFLNREHRAVLSSWVQAGWLDVTSAPDSDQWQWGPVPEEYLSIWKDLGGGRLLSAAVKIQLDLDDIAANRRLADQRFLQLEYEDLIANPIEELSRVIDFCELDWHADFEARMRAVKMHDTRNKWRQHLSDEEGQLVLEFFDRAAGAAAHSELQPTS